MYIAIAILQIHKMCDLGEYSKSEWHESQRMKFERYGHIVREEIAPGYIMVHLFDPKDMEVVSRNEGK